MKMKKFWPLIIYLNLFSSLSHFFVNFDTLSLILRTDAKNNQKNLSGSIQSPDIDSLEDGFRCIVYFNELNQPLRRAGSILVKYLGWLAKIERFCPIGVKNWHEVNNQFKADILERVRGKFVIPDGQTYDKAILMRVGKTWKQYRFTLKRQKFELAKRTKEQIIKDVPQGHTKDNCIRLVEYWYSEKCQKLSSLGKEARKSQTHVHTTGSTSYANMRADFVKSKGKSPSHIEFFEITHKKSEGGFVDNTFSSQFLDEANSKVQELMSSSSPSKSRTEIENEVFNSLMYEEAQPKRPVEFGYGVKQSQVFGVQSILKKGGHGSTSTHDNSTQLETMKARMSDMEKENQELRSIFLQTLQALRSGNITDDVFSGIQAALSKPNSQVASAASGNSARNGLDDLPSPSNS